MVILRQEYVTYSLCFEAHLFIFLLLGYPGMNRFLF